MIIESILTVIFNVFSLLTTPIDIPEFPPEVMGNINSFFEYISAGAGIIANYTHYGFLLVLFGIIIAIDVGISLYKLVMFVLKKIPFLGIE